MKSGFSAAPIIRYISGFITRDPGEASRSGDHASRRRTRLSCYTYQWRHINDATKAAVMTLVTAFIAYDLIPYLFLVAESARITLRLSIIVKALANLPPAERARHLRMIWERGS